MGTVLKGLRRVPWGDLTHAYGAAGGVPTRLARVAWGDAGTAEDALADLGLWLGELAVFDATVAAVPYLWELAVTETVTVRAGVVELLEAILRHGAGQLDVQRAAHQGVSGGRSLLDVLCADPDPSVRAAALALAAVVDGHVCEACRRGSG